MSSADWLLLTAELVAERQWQRREVDRWLGGPTAEYHYQADLCLRRIGGIDSALGELTRGSEVTA